MKITPGRQSLASKLLVACLLLVTATHSVLSDDGGIEEEISMCDDMESCTDCLGAVVCDWYGGSLCSHYTLMIMDIPRYTVDRSTTVEEVCKRASQEEADRDLCYSKTDCASCTSTVLSDGVSTCNYFTAFGFCGYPECGMLGCGEPSCRDPVVPFPIAPEEPLPITPETPEETSTTETTSAENKSVAASTSIERILVLLVALLSVAFL